MIRTVDRFLLALLALAAAAGVLLMALPGRPGSAGASPTLTIPGEIGGWDASDGVPENVLPADPRALETLQRTYRRGPETAWLSVARYPGVNDPQTRPAVFDIVPQHGWVAIGRDVMELPEGHTGRGARINRVVIQRPTRQLVILYWYRLVGKAISSEYELRVRLFVNTLLARPRPLFLIRVASDKRQVAEGFVGPLAAIFNSRDTDAY